MLNTEVISEASATAAPLRKPIGDATLREITRRIATARNDACIVLFGSRARGEGRPDSDIDLLIVTATDKNPLIVAGELYQLLGDRDFGIDLVVMTPDRFARQRGRFDPFIREVLAQGRVLHGRLH